MIGGQVVVRTADGDMPYHLWLLATGGVVDADPRVTVVGPEAVTAPSLHHFGMTDQFLICQVVEQVRVLLEPLPTVTWFGYESADHAFDNHDFFLHDPEASALAWERTSAWLAVTL